MLRVLWAIVAHLRKAPGVEDIGKYFSIAGDCVAGDLKYGAFRNALAVGQSKSLQCPMLECGKGQRMKTEGLFHKTVHLLPTLEGGLVENAVKILKNLLNLLT